VVVEGLGNTKLCFSDPKIGESFIFLTDQLNENQKDFPLELLDHVILRYENLFSILKYSTINL